MQQQSYRHHARYYPPHHFVFYPLLLLLLGASVYMAYSRAPERLTWCAVAAIFFLIGWLSFMLRQHYALGNQDRIVLLEMRFRYFALTGRRLEPLEEELSFGQIKALRFASDGELPALTERARMERLSPDAIKKAIQQWMPDLRRV